MSDPGFPLPLMKKCAICGAPAVVRCGGPTLCDKHLEEQLPILEAYSREVKELIKKYKDLGLFVGYQYREFEFLSCSIHAIYTDPAFYKEWSRSILKANEEKDI
uniref:Uncharacterized protein n=1 Tax=viral metagenome TaxID=1070528 RepID=A0A6M3X584_9ZZZZ